MKYLWVCFWFPPWSSCFWFPPWSSLWVCFWFPPWSRLWVCFWFPQSNLWVCFRFLTKVLLQKWCSMLYHQCCHSVGFYLNCLDFWLLYFLFGFFIIRKLFDISCKSDHVQPISKPLVVLAECGHFVVTWSVRNMWSLGLCRNMLAEPEPFDLLSGWVFKTRFVQELESFTVNVRELAMASSELSTSRLLEEDSSDMDSDSDNEISQIDIDSQIKSLHQSGLLCLQKKKKAILCLS